MTKQGTHGVETLEGNIQEDNAGIKYRNFKTLLGQAGMVSEKPKLT